MASEDESKIEAKKYRSSPIKMDGVHNSMRASIEEPLTKACDEQKYQSCPIKVEGLRNSLRSSIISKRSSMTSGELQFVQSMLQESLGEDELESMHEVLNDSKTFFHGQERVENSLPKEELDCGFATDKPKSPRRSSVAICALPTSNASKPKFARRSSAPESLVLGSTKRQAYLEARKRQAEEQAKKRSKALWKKAACAARMIGKLSNLPMKPLQGAEEEDVIEEVDEESTPAITRPIYTRRASTNDYQGEGFEIGEEAFGIEEEKKYSSSTDEDDDDEYDPREDSRKSYNSLSSQSPRGEGFRRASVNIYGGSGFEVAAEDLFEEIYDGDNRKSYEDYDPWLFQETDKDGKRRDFTILGTSHDDVECQPHVLSPVQMDRFQPFLPDSKKGESFWLKYSLVRDGASTISFLQQVRASPYTLLAMETVDGEVFGGFFASAWTVQPDYFGTHESFLWRMKNHRKLPGSDGKPEESLVEQIERESELEIFPAEVYYCNNFFQMCHKDKIASGGGTTSLPKDFGDDRGGTYEPHQIGFGLQLGAYESLLQGSSSPSLTFRNPPLSKVHADGSSFELLNLEAWGFTPCVTEEEARILEYKNMFFRKHSRETIS